MSALDDSAERGTRVLHVLQELEAGSDPEEISPVTDTLPTPGPPAAAGRRRRARRAVPTIGQRQADGPTGRRVKRQSDGHADGGGRTGADGGEPGRWISTTLARTPSRLAPLERLRAARHVLAVGHENPDADTLGASSPSRSSSSSSAAGRRRVLRPGAAAVRLPAGRRPRAHRSRRTSRSTCWSLSDCAHARIASGAWRSGTRLCSPISRASIVDHHVSNDGAGRADWIDPAAAATCEMVALLAVRLGVPLDAADGALATALMAGIVMDTATFAHPNATPRTLAVAAALVEAGAPLSDISRRLYRTKPDAQLRLFGRVLDRLRASADGRVLWSTLLAGRLRCDRRPAGPLRGDHRPAGPVRDGRGRRCCSRSSPTPPRG